MVSDPGDPDVARTLGGPMRSGDANPGEHAKNRSFRDPGGHDLPETDAEETARRLGTTGRDLGNR
ncbi:hypothetical protein [Rubellimicrobium sp. CFH 75288]|uniref:hypothetical protein n=1 Tax=Rubellimicrobium sp. CFH 75288 TaxID=2697034 RepID=UPI001412F831|nr:hypothetical protein [Rubellimicrobium sp. CFH 75288]NAZ37931.1 hypothetical protein [Rubellimicrobium sp. CFH 75288]